MSDALSLDAAGAFLKSLDKAQMGAAASKLSAASVGEIVAVLARSSLHKHYTLADLEWMVLPAVSAGQFYVVEVAHRERGFLVPVAVATWAFVSKEVDARLLADLSRRIRLRPDEWTSGEIAWIVDLVGAPAGIRQAVGWMQAGPFKERAAKVVMCDAQGCARIDTLKALVSASAKEDAT